MLAFVFPGQGSQRKGMGAELFDQFPEIVNQADHILGYSIKALCLSESGEKLNKTQYTQPALYTVNAMMYLNKIQETNKSPDIVAGHSLGEYNALLAAGAFDFATGLKLVKKRGELMSLATGGGMAAVIGLDYASIHQVLTSNKLTGIDIANHNSPQQLVISGLKEDIDQAKSIFEGIESVRYIPLMVSGAFHSRYMRQAANAFEEYVSAYCFNKLKIPVISNIQARPYKDEDIHANLIKQMTQSVKWCESIQVLLGFPEIEIKEIGPGRVLTGLTSKIAIEAESIAISLDECKKEKDTKSQGNPKIQLEKLNSSIHQPQESKFEMTAESLGCEQFKEDYQLKFAYIAGAMYKGIASKELVVKMGKAGMMGFFGTGGLELEQIEDAIRYIQRELRQGEAYGMNLLHTPNKPEKEEQQVDLFMKYGVRNIEASAYIHITPALIKFRAGGLFEHQDGSVSCSNRIIAKISRPEVAECFLSPAPEHLVKRMLEQNIITSQQARMLQHVPITDDLCLEADSGGHTDGGVAFALMPSITRLRDDMVKKYGYPKKIRIGAAGGIGTPIAAAAAFTLGADFIVTGSINQCTIEAATSDTVKDMLQQINIQDTAYAPAGDMFEFGARVQVLKRGVFFPARANKLYEIYMRYNSIDEIDEKLKIQLEERYFKRSFEDVFHEVKLHYPKEEIENAQNNPKRKMALIFKWYFAYSSRIALAGITDSRVDYQVHCGPALGAFNQWVKGSELESWHNRRVDEIGVKIMMETAKILQQQFQVYHEKMCKKEYTT